MMDKLEAFLETAVGLICGVVVVTLAIIGVLALLALKYGVLEVM